MVYLLHSVCIRRFNVELDKNHLRTELAKHGVKRIRTQGLLKSESEESETDSEDNFCMVSKGGCMPMDFNNIGLKIKDKEGLNTYKFRINIQETKFDSEVTSGINQENLIIYESDKKERVLFVIHMCKGFNGSNDGFYICSDKECIDIDNHAFNDYPKISTDDGHILYKLKISNHNFPSKKA